MTETVSARAKAGKRAKAGRRVKAVPKAQALKSTTASITAKTGSGPGTGSQHRARLGKNHADHDKRTLQLAEYLTGPVQHNGTDLRIPATVDPPAIPEWGLAGNRNYSDCVPAALLHLQQVFSALANQRQGLVGAAVAPAPITDRQAIEFYAALGGHDIGVSSTDRGVSILHTLKWWLHRSRPRRSSSGDERTLEDFGLGKISAFAAWEPGNLEQLKGTIATLGGVLLGLRLPVTAQLQRVWSVPPGGPQNWGAPGSWDGHCVVAVGYNAECVRCVTWGGIKYVTWQFIATYCDEGFAVFGDSSERNIRVFDANGDASYVRQDQIMLPATVTQPSRSLAQAIKVDTKNLPKQPRWGMGGRIWIDRPPPGHWEYVP